MDVLYSIIKKILSYIFFFIKKTEKTEYSPEFSEKEYHVYSTNYRLQIIMIRFHLN